MLSALGTAASSLTLALALNHHQAVLSAASMIAFVIFFSIGLAPVAWVVLGEVLPQEARTAAGSVGVSVNWLTNFAAVSTSLDMTHVGVWIRLTPDLAGLCLLAHLECTGRPRQRVLLIRRDVDLGSGVGVPLLSPIRQCGSREGGTRLVGCGLVTR